MWNEKMYRRIWCSIYKPLKDCIGEGPQRLECTNCKEVAYFAFDVEKDNLYRFYQDNKWDKWKVELYWY